MAENQIGNSQMEAAMQPFLTKFSVRRVGESEALPGRYCHARHVWVIETEGGITPLISFMETQADTSTTTRVRQERPDATVTARWELTTKTSAPLERDDTSPGRRYLSELLTKTDARTERDDR